MRKIKLVLGASILLLVSGQVNASLIVNGGFEDPTIVGPYEHRNGDELTGWTLFSTYRGTVQFDTSYAAVSEGSQAVQIEVPGDWISQSFATLIGQEYKVSFDLSAYPVYGGPNLGYTKCAPFCLSVLGVTAGSASGEFSGISVAYLTHALLFTADSTTSTVKFKNLYDGDGWGNYPHLDNVSVGAVPAPAAVWLFGTGLIGLIGFTKRRKAA
jgi:hypothetical protein